MDENNLKEIVHLKNG